MPASREAAPPTVASSAPAKACARRLETFRREQLIVDFLNPGVSVAGIAVRVGVGGKRMRSIIREIVDRRVPSPAEAFVAVQMSRRNEALMVAFGAMTGANLGRPGGQDLA
ncbi:MAG: hypothetical protein JO312_16385 [Hyphomicrobiales bacterium]|nr:hypothetical protein [Hyphomicrobiales bacterium]